MNREKRIYFASDFHLGAASDQGSKEREKKVVRWLESVRHDAGEIYLLGDLFDFWFEYTHVVPRGHVRLLGKLAELSDAGIPITIFTGNHDVWIFDYLPSELGVTLCRIPVEREWSGKKFVIGHGDGLGPGDEGYKLIKKLFTNRMAQRMFAFLHPYLGVKLARFFSRKSRESTGHKDAEYLGPEREFLVQYCLEELKKHHVDYFVFGHRHLALDIELGGGSRYVNLGEWFTGCNYAVFDGNTLELKRFEG